MSQFALAVFAAPYSSQASVTAYRFALALLEQGHSIIRVFFYQDGVHNASNLASPPQDEFDLSKAWQELAQQHQIDMVVCIAAALRRGIINQEEASRYEKPASNLDSTYSLSGLGQLVEAAVSADRLICFGG